MGQPARQEDQGPIMHRVRSVVNDCILYANSNDACVITIRCFIVDCLF
jgi:hypothetical protein